MYSFFKSLTARKQLKLLVPFTLLAVLTSLVITVPVMGQQLTSGNGESSTTPASYQISPAEDYRAFVPAGSTNLTGSILNTGKFVNALTISSEDQKAKLNIVPDTYGLDKDGKALTVITIMPADNPPLPEKTHIIGLPYSLGPDGATFVPGASLIMAYDPATLPEGITEENMVAAYYDAATGEWVEILGTLNPAKHTITATVTHFSVYAILAHEPEPEPVETTVPEPTVTTAPEPVQTEAPTVTVTVTQTVKPQPTKTPEPTETTPVLTIPPSTTPEPIEFDTNWPFLYSIIGGVVIISTILSIVFRRRKD